MMFFSKPKGWAELSKEDQAWAKTLKKANSAEVLAACAQNNQASRICFIFNNRDTYQIKVEHIQRAVSAAVQNQSTEALKGIYGHTTWTTGYTQDVIIQAIKNKSVEILKFVYERVGEKQPEFFDGWTKNFGLFTTLSETGSKACWDIAVAGNDALPKRLRMSVADIVELAVQYGFAEAYDDVLEKKAAPEDTQVFEKALNEALRRSPDTMAGVLWWKDRFPGAPAVLNDVLCQVAAEGKIRRAKMLIDAGADVNHGQGRAFKAAANSGELEMLKLLVEKGADAQACGPSLIAALLNGDDKQKAVGRYLDDGFFDGRHQKIREKTEENKNFALAGADTLAEKKALPFGGTLTILFNFALRQQTVIAQDAAAKKETMAMQVINFCDIEKEALDHAAQKFIALGGDPKLTEELKIRKTGGLTRE